MEDADVINADVHKFDNFIWYGADTDFERIDDTIFTLNASASGVFDIDYNYESGDNTKLSEVRRHEMRRTSFRTLQKL